VVENCRIPRKNRGYGLKNATERLYNAFIAPQKSANPGIKYSVPHSSFSISLTPRIALVIVKKRGGAEAATSTAFRVNFLFKLIANPLGNEAPSKVLAGEVEDHVAGAGQHGHSIPGRL
jgi:hypothetical protein